MNIRILFMLFIVPVLSSCAAMRSASPEDAKVVLAKSTKYTTGAKTLGATKETRIPLRPGQWAAALIRSKSNPNDVILQISKVANVSGSSVTVETEQYASSESGKRIVMQQRMQNVPTAPKVYTKVEQAAIISNIKVDSMKIMDDEGKVQELPQLPLNFGKLGANLFQSSVATGEVQTKPCESSEIKAAKCFAVPYSVKVLWMSDQGVTNAHSDVPVLGFVSAEGKDSRTDVIGFGNSGAEILIR